MLTVEIIALLHYTKCFNVKKNIVLFLAQFIDNKYAHLVPNGY